MDFLKQKVALLSQKVVATLSALFVSLVLNKAISAV